MIIRTLHAGAIPPPDIPQSNEIRPSAQSNEIRPSAQSNEIRPSGDVCG